MLTRATTFSVITTGFVLSWSAAAVHAQTAACCLIDESDMTPGVPCPTVECQVLNELECAEQHGDWLGALDSPVLDCDGTPNPCLLGTCCVEDDGCDDNNGEKMTCEACKAMGNVFPYHGGVTCADVSCAICPFEDVDHCQRPTGECVFPCPLTPPGKWADDFIPAQSGLIKRVCYWHEYAPPQGGECSDTPADDDISIRFYEDMFGLPGTELANSPGSDAEWDSRGSQPGFRMWRYSAPIDPGVEVEVDTCYWIEITSAGRPDCIVGWRESRDGNNYRLRDVSGLDGVAGYGYEDIKDSDLSWCIDLGIVPASIPWVDGGCGDGEVACCRRDGTCTEETVSTCRADNGVFVPIGPGYPYESCADFSCPLPLNDDCADAEPICQNVCTHPTDHLLSSRWSCETTADCPPPDECLPWAPDPDNGYCVNADILDDGPVCSRSDQDCYDGSQCEEYARNPNIYRCFVDKDNELASTDGPPAGGGCFLSGENSFQADVWHKITSPCRGVLVVDECRSQLTYDGMLAVHGDGTADYADTACPITTNDDLIMCNDDFCPGSATVSGVQADVLQGATYLLRSGGWSGGGSIDDASQGSATMNIGFICAPPPPPCGPQLWALPPEPEHQMRKNRYISMNTAAYELSVVAYQVTLAEMNRCSGDTRRACVVDDDCPGVCSGNNNIQCSTDEICTANGAGTCTATAPCEPHPDVGNVVGYFGEPFTRSCFPNDDCAGEFFANVVDAPVYRVWSEDTVHVTGCEIVPAAAYEIVTFDQLSGEGICPVTIGTTPKPAGLQYGDVAGPVGAGAFGAPDGFVSVIDVSAYLITNQGGVGSTVPAHTTWIDLHGDADEICDSGVPCVVPQGILNVSDLSRIKFGFIGKTYTETPGQVAPGDCP